MADENVTNGEFHEKIVTDFEANGADKVIKAGEDVSKSNRDVVKSANEAADGLDKLYDKLDEKTKSAQKLGKAVASAIPQIGAKLSELGHSVTDKDLQQMTSVLMSVSGAAERVTQNLDHFLSKLPAQHKVFSHSDRPDADAINEAFDEAKKRGGRLAGVSDMATYEDAYKYPLEAFRDAYSSLVSELTSSTKPNLGQNYSGMMMMSDKDAKELKRRTKITAIGSLATGLDEATPTIEAKAEKAGKAAAEGLAKGAGDGPRGPSGIEALGDAAGKKYVKAYEKAVNEATHKTAGGIGNKNYNLLSPEAQARGRGRNRGLGEKLVDTSKLTEVGDSISKMFDDVNDKVIGQATQLEHQLSQIYADIPATVSRLGGGNIVNSVAMDAKTAYGEIESLINELKTLPNTLSMSSDMSALQKEVAKYKKEWQDASDKRDAFVINTSSHNVKLYNEIQKEIEQQTRIRDAAQKVIDHMRSQGVSEKDSEMVKYQKDVDAAVRKIRSLNKEQLKLYADRSVANNKTTYETYTTKMYDANVKLQQAMEKLDQVGGADGLTNVTEVTERASALYQEITARLTKLGDVTKQARVEQENLSKSAGELNAKYRGLKPPKGMVKTDEFKNLEKQYRSAYKALQTLSDKQEKYLQNGTKVDSKAWKNLELDIEQARQKLEEYDALLTKAQADGNAFTTKKNFIDLRWSDVFGSGWGKAFADAMSAGVSSFKKTTSVTFGALKKMLLGIWSLVPKIGKGIKDWAKNQKSLGDSAKQMYKTFTGYLSMLRTRIRRKFISMVFEDLQNNIKALAKMSPRLNKVISDFIVSTKTLGAQIVAAFEPLVAKVLPYITMFVDYLTYAAQQMSQFISQLFGDDTWIKAVKGQYNFAESVDNSTSSTKKATKAAKEYENTVLSFDELHKLNGNDSGSDGDEDGLTGVDLKHAEVEANKLMEIARKIHKALSEGDFYGAGKAMGEGINEAFAWLRDTAGWSKNADKFTKWAENAINLVNGLIDGIDGLANGQAIGDVINSVINIADKLTDPEAGIHFYEAGKTLGETFVSALLEIDWQTAGRALMNGLQGIARGVTGFLTAQVYTMKNKTTGETRYARKDETGRPVWNDGTVVDPNEWNIEEDAMTGAQALGRGLRKMFVEAIKTFDVETWSELLKTLVEEFFTFIGELFAEPEQATEFGRKLGQTINETIKKIDMGTVATGINNFTHSLTGFFDGLLSEFDVGGFLEQMKALADQIDWGPIGIIIGAALAPGLVTGLFSAVGSLVKTLGTAWIVSKILGISGSGAAGGAAAGGAGLLGWLGAGAKTVGSILLGSYAGVGWSEFLGQVTNGKLGISEEHANKFYQDPFGGIGKTIQADLLGLKQMVGDIAGNVFGAEWGKDWYNSATQGLQAISDKVNGVQESVDAMNSDEFNTMWSQMKDEMYGDDAKLMNMDGQTFLDNATTSIPSLTLPADGTVLSSAPTEDFRKDIAEQIGATFKDALASSAGDIVLMVNEGVLGRVSMNQQAKYTKQYLATSPKFSTT